MGIRGQYTRQTDTRVSSGREMEAFFAGRDRRGGTAYLTILLYIALVGMELLGPALPVD